MTFFANPSANWQSGFDATWTAVAAAGSEIGNHTWSHCHASLSDCTPVGTVQDEIDDATAYIIEPDQQQRVRGGGDPRHRGKH
jgi:peptidoglycan/xylan/chitin deacetylase (PgdA/CDA1 family)